MLAGYWDAITSRIDTMRLTLTALGLALLATTPAWATGTLFCEASDDQVHISFHAIVPYGSGSPLTQAEGTVTVSKKGNPPAVVRLNGVNNTQYWMDADMINLRFYTEGEVGTELNSAELTIKTRVRAADDAYFDGEFHFESYRGLPDGTGEPIRVNLDGSVTCSFG
jgi:hypothetical protein